MQLIELYYLLYRRYFAYAIVLLILSNAAMGGLISALADQHRKLVTLVNQRYFVPVVQRGWIRAMSSHQLVPGDVIVVQKGKPTCDMALLRGSCLVEESMLSGEVRRVSMLPCMVCRIGLWLGWCGVLILVSVIVMSQ